MANPSNLFKRGQSGNPSGRPKGTTNKFKYDVAAILKESKCNPFEILANIANGVGKDEKERITPRLRMEAASELASYVAPKLKAVEHSTSDDSQFAFNVYMQPEIKLTEQSN